MTSAPGEITTLLQRADGGDPEAADRILTLVYDELHQLAAANVPREPSGSTLRPAVLVHEAWRRLGGDAEPAWRDRVHFVGAAAEAMRRILVDSIRRGRSVPANVEDTAVDAEMLLVHEALDDLALHAPRQAELLKLRYFVGLTIEEAAGALDISPSMAKREWHSAHAWLFREVDS